MELAKALRLITRNGDGNAEQDVLYYSRSRPEHVLAFINDISNLIDIRALAARYLIKERWEHYLILKDNPAPMIREGVVLGLYDSGKPHALRQFTHDLDSRVADEAKQALEDLDK